MLPFTWGTVTHVGSHLMKTDHSLVEVNYIVVYVMSELLYCFSFKRVAGFNAAIYNGLLSMSLVTSYVCMDGVVSYL